MASAVKTETSTPGLVLVDHDDFQANQAAYERLEAESFPRGWRIQKTVARGMGGKVREAWPLVRNYPYVGILNDDNECVTPHWDARLIKHLDGTNFVSCNDLWQAPARAAGLTLWSMPLLECVGWPIFPPQIEHLGIDDVWELLGRATGCWKVDLDVIIKHQHIFLGAATDETHKRTYGEGPWANSPAARDTEARLKLFIELEFRDAVQKIKDLAKRDYFPKTAS